MKQKIEVIENVKWVWRRHDKTGCDKKTKFYFGKSLSEKFVYEGSYTNVQVSFVPVVPAGLSTGCTGSIEYRLHRLYR